MFDQVFARLDAERRAAEATCTDPARWDALAEQYALFGMDCQAAACRRRAAHYAGAHKPANPQAAHRPLFVEYRGRGKAARP